MKTVQKLELLAGFATFASTLIFIYFVDMPQSRKIADLYNDSNGYNWAKAILSLILPSLLIAISSLIHITKNSKTALGVIIILGGIMSFLYAIGFLIGSAFEGHILIGTSPGLFAFATIILALINTILVYTKREKIS